MDHARLAGSGHSGHEYTLHPDLRATVSHSENTAIAPTRGPKVRPCRAAFTDPAPVYGKRSPSLASMPFRESDDTTVHGATRRGSVHALLAQVPCLVPHTEQYRESLAGMARDSTVTTQITAQNRGSRFLAGVPSRLPRTNTLPAFRLRLHLLLSPRCGSPWRPSSHPEVDIVRRFCQCGRGSAVRSSFARDRLEGMRRPGRETLLVVHA